MADSGTSGTAWGADGEIRRFIEAVTPQHRAALEQKQAAARAVVAALLEMGPPQAGDDSVRLAMFSAGRVHFLLNELSEDLFDQRNYAMLLTAELLLRLQGGSAAVRVPPPAVAPPHDYQEFNVYDNTCHYPGCRLTIDEHSR